MVAVGILGSGIAAEALPPAIVIMIYGLACPAFLAFDPEMIVGPFHQVAGAGLGLMDPLGKGNGSRYPCPLHFRHGQVLIGIDIVDPIRAGLCQQTSSCYNYET